MRLEDEVYCVVVDWGFLLGMDEECHHIGMFSCFNGIQYKYNKYVEKILQIGQHAESMVVSTLCTLSCPLCMQSIIRRH